ncbi:MAG: hypothetical protein CMG35_04070 [Candidatus Marinimicrobia bacterium]|mgnify:FL=1|jgi:AbrB family looped-hinge helix DNA binding protein|nr:hypothetical protein [Candidatus Neomarinimicrobiota bacterium]|tara:strand:+ start:97 stop:291 length:195 start_codon:yes stop_codon:yes gene_type:complete
MTIESLYKKEEIFTNVDKEKGTVDMTIPEEVKSRMGWKEGDVLAFKVLDDGSIEVTKKDLDSAS